MKHLKLTATILLLSISNLIFAQKDRPTAETVAKDRSYSIINPGETITIYKYVHKAHVPREADKYGPKYFFTTPASNVLQALTIDNLKAAYPDNHAFHDALDATFKEDKELTMYDRFHKTYKVNWLLKRNI